MTITDLAKLIDKTGTIRVQQMLVNVVIVDVKSSYGRTRYQVRPLSGSGLSWFDAASIQLEVSNG